MSWPASLGVGALTAILTGILAGVIANLAVDWYRISSFEGAAGYFVVAMALVGAAAGALIGVLASRITGDAGGPVFLRAIGAAWLVSLTLLGIVAGVTRLLADVPPRLNGRALVLALELRWPEGLAPTGAPDSSAWQVRLSALRGRVARASTEGPLWREDVRFDDGRWVMPGAVDIFTGRGERMLSFEPDLTGEGFIVPLPGRPGRQHLAWTDWLPQRSSAAADTGRFHYRFRVVPDDQPIRTERIGPFDVETIASGFAKVRPGGGPVQWTANAQYRVRYGGDTVVIEHEGEVGEAGRFDRMDAVSVIAGLRPALLVQVGASAGQRSWYLLVDEGNALRTERIAEDADGSGIQPITNDIALFAATRDRAVPSGQVDRTTFASPGAFLLPSVVIDTRTLTVRRFTNDEPADIIDRIPPLGIAPDGMSFARLAWADDAEHTSVAVIGLAGHADERVPIDRSRMRFADIDQVDPAWLAHYFEWRRESDGADHLVERAGAIPLPYRGVLTMDGSGYREYRLSPARAGLRAAFEDFLVTEFGAERIEADESEFAHEVRIGDATVNVSYRAEDGHVGLWMDRGTDSSLVATIAKRFDEALTTGRFDPLFGN